MWRNCSPLCCMGAACSHKLIWEGLGNSQSFQSSGSQGHHHRFLFAAGDCPAVKATKIFSHCFPRWSPADPLPVDPYCNLLQLKLRAGSGRRISYIGEEQTRVKTALCRSSWKHHPAQKANGTWLAGLGCCWIQLPGFLLQVTEPRSRSRLSLPFPYPVTIKVAPALSRAITYWRSNRQWLDSLWLFISVLPLPCVFEVLPWKVTELCLICSLLYENQHTTFFVFCWF